MRETKVKTLLATPAAPVGAGVPRPEQKSSGAAAAHVRKPSPLAANLGPAVRATVVTLLLTGLAYPLAVTGLSRLFFPARSAGSFVADASGKVVGSELIAQPFTGPQYFQPRPSAAGEKGWDAANSSGSNLGPTSKKLRDQAAQLTLDLAKANPGAALPVPAELVTASASGLDPHLSPQAVLWQAPRVAAARHVSAERILALVAEFTEGRDLAVLGEPRVNILLLNLALDRRMGPVGGVIGG